MSTPPDDQDASTSPATDALLQFGDALVVAEERFRTRRSRQRRRGLRLGGAVAGLAAAGTAAVLVVGGSAPPQIDVVAEARAALAPKAGILHIRAVVTDESSVNGREVRHAPGTFRQRWEQWRATDPDRWRVKVYASKRLRRTPGGIVQPAVAPSEVAFAGGVESNYRALEGKLHIVTGLPARVGKEPPSILSDRRGSSVEELRAMLDRGELDQRGATRVAGRPARRLVGRTAGLEGRTLTVDYAVDPESFKPMRVTTALRAKGGRLILRHRIDFEVFETLRPTPRNERLLRIDPPPGTSVTKRTLAEMRAIGEARDRQGRRP